MWHYYSRILHPTQRGERHFPRNPYWYMIQRDIGFPRRGGCPPFLKKVSAILEIIQFHLHATLRKRYQLCVWPYRIKSRVRIHVLLFSKMVTVFTKKSPGQPVWVCRCSDNSTIFTGWAPFSTDVTQWSHTYKHKNNVTNNRVSLCVIDCQHDTFCSGIHVMYTRDSRVWVWQRCCDGRNVCYIAD